MAISSSNTDFKPRDSVWTLQSPKFATLYCITKHLIFKVGMSNTERQPSRIIVAALLFLLAMKTVR